MTNMHESLMCACVVQKMGTSKGIELVFETYTMNHVPIYVKR